MDESSAFAGLVTVLEMAILFLKHKKYAPVGR